ncbi:putative protoheme IX synthesis domain protein [Bordetella holmesii 70147]|nr:putative protoheme IX synthesis domain protein [Bordetella holmesii 70147]
MPLRSAVDIEEYFDSAPIPQAAFEAPVSSFQVETSVPEDKPAGKV